MITVHILDDNRVHKRGLLAEHGLSLWIEKGDTTILFDTGQSNVYAHNAQAMGIQLESADYIVISHGHYDHCGGLQYFPWENSKTVVLSHPQTFRSKFSSSKDGQPRPVGIPFDASHENWQQTRMIHTKQPLRLDSGIVVSGEIPLTHSFEQVSSNFYVQNGEELVPDELNDEQMLIIEDGSEMAVFLGCSHRGVVNSVHYAQRLVPNKKIKLLVAGMHMENAGHTQLQLTIQYLKSAGIRQIVPLHCTGLRAKAEMKRFLGNHCSLLSTGDTIQI